MTIPQRIHATAPTRVCDIGGWTDTWFAGEGCVFNIAVTPFVEVQIDSTPLDQMGTGFVDADILDQQHRVALYVENYGDRFAVDPDHVAYDNHPLIEAAIDAMPIPPDVALHVAIYSSAPPGASMGTSAAVAVALVGALDALTPGRMTPYQAARAAHRLETEKLGLQSGIQDQLASAYGGINLIEMHAFPHAAVSAIPLPDSLAWELEQRLVTIYIGVPHSSSAVHQQVIGELGEDARDDPRMVQLRDLAHGAKDAIYAGDFHRLGRIMNQNTDVQRTLHPSLVCPSFEEIIQTARDFDVLGCKVNGAGGDGGSLTILTDGDRAKQRRMLVALTTQGYTALNTTIARHGLLVWPATS